VRPVALAALLGICLSAGACESVEGPAAGTTASAAPTEMGPMHRRLLGTYSMEPGAGHLERVRAQLATAVPSAELEARMRMVRKILKGTELEITQGTIVSRQEGQVLATDAYVVLSESAEEVVIRVTKAEPGRGEQRFRFRPDGSIVAESSDLGSMILRRK